MTALAWMPLYVADYLADTGHLCAVEHGAYLLLIMHYWQVGSLPPDDKKLARLARLSDREWRKVKPTIATFFSPDWKHERVEAERAKAAGFVHAKARAGQRGAGAKWGSVATGLSPSQIRAQRLSDARQKACHTPDEWLALRDIFGGCVKCKIPSERLHGGACVKDHIVPLYKGGSDGIENIQPLCRNCNSAKGPEETDWRDIRISNWRELFAECLANGSQMSSPPPSPPPIPKEESKSFFNAGGIGKVGNSNGVTVQSPADRIAIFQRKLAARLGQNGWMIVGAAADMESPEHSRSLEICKNTAKELGKGWPRNWPNGCE